MSIRNMDMSTDELWDRKVALSYVKYAKYGLCPTYAIWCGRMLYRWASPEDQEQVLLLIEYLEPYEGVEGRDWTAAPYPAPAYTRPLVLKKPPVRQGIDGQAVGAQEK